MTATATQTLSFSRLSTYHRCGEQFRLLYVEKATPRIPQGALLGGSTVHDLIAYAEKERLWGLDQEELVGELWGSWWRSKVKEAGGPREIRWGGRKTKAFPSGEDHLWWLSQGRVMLKRWASQRRLDEDLGFSLAFDNVELQVLAEIHGHQIRGFIDCLVLVTPDGERIVRDWKTGQVGGADPLQLATYAWILRQGPGIGVDRGEFVYLRGKDEGRRRPYDLRALLPLIERQFGDLLRGVEEEIFPVRPSTMCPSCSVRKACPYGATLGEGDLP